jgi:hypothetical protein
MSENASALRPALAVASSLLFAVFAFGCGPKTVVVAVPPRIDLQGYNTIGVVDFAADPADKLNEFATQRFMAVVQASQPNVRFLELGPMDRLQSPGRDRLDPDAVKSLGKRHNVDTIFTGSYEISSVKPQIRLGDDLSSVSASAAVRISLTLKHWDTKTGAVVWTNTRYGKWPVASLSTGTTQPISVSVSDPRDRYGDFMEQLIQAATDDFRVHYERRPVTAH